MRHPFLKTVSLLLISIFIAITGLLISSISYAKQDSADVDWNLVKDKKDIQVYTRKVAGSKFRAVLTTVEVNASAESVVALLKDLENCRDWAKTCKEARLVKKNTDLEEIVYGRKNLPFPVLDRDVYSINIWSLDSNTGVIEMNSRAHTEQEYPKVSNVVRVHHANVTWRIIPLQAGRVLLENITHIDPNGKIPIWLTNILLVDVPYKAMRRLRAVLKTGRYDNAKVAILE